MWHLYMNEEANSIMCSKKHDVVVTHKNLRATIWLFHYGLARFQSQLLHFWQCHYVLTEATHTWGFITPSLNSDSHGGYLVLDFPTSDLLKCKVDCKWAALIPSKSDFEETHKKRIFCSSKRSLMSKRGQRWPWVLLLVSYGVGTVAVKTP